MQNRLVALGELLLCLAEPLAKLLPDWPHPGYGTAARFRMNVFRSSPGRTTLCWSPIFTKFFLEGIYRMGEVELARPKAK